MRSKEELQQLNEVREKLKECRPEWLEKNAKGQDALSVLTVQQILDYATEGITSWDFEIKEQWREEVNRFDRNQNTWVFDGYVYHVKGSMHIKGLGRRDQYGSKVGVGGVNNQNSAYKAAASDCLKKCASLFGVGSSVYSSVQIETESEVEVQQEAVAQQNTQQYYQQDQQQHQQQYIEQQVLPNGDIQQGEWIWTNNNWVHYTQYNTEQSQVSPRLSEEGQKAQWYHDTMKEFDPQGYEEMKEKTGPSPLEQQQNLSEQEQHDAIIQAIKEADTVIESGEIDYPFLNVPPKDEEANTSQDNNNEAVASDFVATPKQEAETNDFVAVESGEPAEHVDVEEVEPKEVDVQEDPLKDIVAENPWDTPENKVQIDIFGQHKERLNIENDKDLLPHVRDYFKDEEATISSVTPDILEEFNIYLQNIQA